MDWLISVTVAVLIFVVSCVSAHLLLQTMASTGRRSTASQVLLFLLCLATLMMTHHLAYTLVLR
jgi:hypothetical protein